MKDLFDVKSVFFKPLWRRVVVVVVVLGWALFELSNGATIWAGLFGVVGIYLIWQFYVIDWSEIEDKAETPEKDDTAT